MLACLYSLLVDIEVFESWPRRRPILDNGFLPRREPELDIVYKLHGSKNIHWRITWQSTRVWASNEALPLIEDSCIQLEHSRLLSLLCLGWICLVLSSSPVSRNNSSNLQLNTTCWYDLRQFALPLPTTQIQDDISVFVLTTSRSSFIASSLLMGLPLGPSLGL